MEVPSWPCSQGGKEARAPCTQDGFASSQEVFLEQNPPKQNSLTTNIFLPAPAAQAHRSVVVCIIWERKPSPFQRRPQAPKHPAGQISQLASYPCTLPVGQDAMESFG